jgi:lipopolysaccharide/colanic/teichoic acid biosynthesis glycosyltransferase
VNLRQATREIAVSSSIVDPGKKSRPGLLCEQDFMRSIAIERKRTERTQLAFLLVLMEPSDQGRPDDCISAINRVAEAIIHRVRETDFVGWYRAKEAAGVVFTGLESTRDQKVIGVLLGGVRSIIRQVLDRREADLIRISHHIYPEEWDREENQTPTNPTLYPDLREPSPRRRLRICVKRTADVVGSATLLLLCSPMLLVVAATVKLTSKGPVFFRQKRVGQHGRPFTFLKFRSMHENNDHSEHEEFVRKLIHEPTGNHATGKNGERVYKMTDDKRVTAVGKWIRRSSLDELPQLFNVLCGDMSLVGPRPPIPYEVALYQVWHRRRVLDVKPGITGLWQVSGRSCLKFDEMVRLDLRYVKTWTPWLDLKILLKTPAAVVRGSGAY